MVCTARPPRARSACRLFGALWLTYIIISCCIVIIIIIGFLMILIHSFDNAILMSTMEVLVTRPCEKPRGARANGSLRGDTISLHVATSRLTCIREKLWTSIGTCRQNVATCDNMLPNVAKCDNMWATCEQHVGNMWRNVAPRPRGRSCAGSSGWWTASWVRRSRTWGTPTSARP